MLLEKGRAAPYSGILLPESEYREMVFRSEGYDRLLSEVVTLEVEVDKLNEPCLEKSFLPFIGGGILMGIIAAFLVR